MSPDKPDSSTSKEFARRAWLECKICGRHFTVKRYFTLHRDKGSCASDKQLLECEICGKKFPCYRSYDLRIHRYRHTGERPYPCSICGVSFISRTEKNKHERSHENSEVWFECEKCDRKFGEEKHLEEHLSSHVEEEPLFEYECGICGECFRNRESQTRHERYHAAQRTYDKKPNKKRHLNCKICGKKYQYKKSFIMHSKQCVS